jgi:signal transduction histidine kinase/CheY-like chemotaxis protein
MLRALATIFRPPLGRDNLVSIPGAPMPRAPHRQPDCPADPAPAEAATLDLARRFDLLQGGLDLIDQGLTVIDAELKLVAWNRRFFTLLEFPMELARVGTPFEAFIRFNAQRGEYGAGDRDAQVAERVRLAESFQPHYLERQRPNGTIIAIRGEPLPHRGFVTIYTDITRQRQHELIIRERNEELDRRVRARTIELEAANAGLHRAMAEQKRMGAALMQAQQMEAVGKLTGGLAHDFNNLLTIIIANLAALRDRQTTGELNEFLDPAIAAARRGADITKRLLAFARRQPLEPRSIEVNAIVGNILTLLRRSLPAHIAVVTETERGELFSMVDPAQLENALLNLALNARDAMPQGGTLVIRSASRRIGGKEAAELDIADGRYVAICVEDNGTGMTPETLARVFEPFFTSKEFGTGSGLGLSTIYGFAKQSGGAVRIRSQFGVGTAVTLFLREGPPADAATEEPAHRTQRAAGIRHVALLVEDDPDVRTVIRRQLTELGHLVIEASGGKDALNIVENIDELSLLVSDIMMPGDLDGRRLAERARALRPDIRVILITGYAERLDDDAGERFVILDKPCSKEELAAAIDEATP